MLKATALEGHPEVNRLNVDTERGMPPERSRPPASSSALRHHRTSFHHIDRVAEVMGGQS
jgi:hypothetical protein